MAWVPTPSRGCDVRALHLAPVEGFVLSRIDGSTDLDQLAMITGLTAARLEDPGDPGARGRGRGPSGRAARCVADRGRLGHELPAPALRDATAPTAPGRASGTREHRRRAGAVRPLLRPGSPGRGTGPRQPTLRARPCPLDLGAPPQCGRLRGPRRPRGVPPRWRSPALPVRNPQTPAHLLRALLLKRRLPELYRAGHDREASERTRAAARELLRERFAKGSSEERADLVVITEGRALAALSGLSLDARTTALLCSRPFASTLLIENLARWPATPPTLVAHLLAQPTVQRSPQLRTLVKRHPNAPRSPA